MRICPSCKKAHLKAIWHLNKDFRCQKCFSEYRVSKIWVFVILKILFVCGIVVGLYSKNPFIFIGLPVLSVIAREILRHKYLELELIGSNEG